MASHFCSKTALGHIRTAERQQSNVTLVLLDWEKAFDKINQSKLLQVLRCLKTPPNMLRLVTHMYAHPKFRITTEGISSRYRRQESGIRQGCLLSPFLLILLMGALFHDLKSKLNTPKQLEPIKGIRYAEVLYADDTLTFGTHTQSINIFLHAIPRESLYYNLNLNYDKCINLALHQKQSSVKYLDGAVPAWLADGRLVSSSLFMKPNRKRGPTGSRTAPTVLPATHARQGSSRLAGWAGQLSTPNSFAG